MKMWSCKAKRSQIIEVPYIRQVSMEHWRGKHWRRVYDEADVSPQGVQQQPHVLKAGEAGDFERSPRTLCKWLLVGQISIRNIGSRWPVGGKIWKHAAAGYRHRYREVKSISEKITSVHLQLITMHWTLYLFLSSPCCETDPSTVGER